MSDYFNDPWCFNLTLIIINGLVILSTIGFLINRTENIKECSVELFWTATIFEIYLVGLGVWYFWLLLDQPKGIDNYERIETENSTGSLASSFRKIMNGNGQTLFNQEGSKTKDYQR